MADGLAMPSTSSSVGATSARMPGSGRSREFLPETAYIVALLLKLGRTEVDELRAVVRTITAMIAGGGDNAALWRAAKDRLDARNGSIFAAVSIENGNRGPSAVMMGLARSAGGFDTPSFRVEGDSVILINITLTFARIKRFP